MVLTRSRNLTGAAIAALLLFGCDLAPAQTLLPGFVTAHRDRCGVTYGGMNQNNAGLGIRLDDGPLTRSLNAGFIAGLATGYGRRLVPLASPEIVLSLGLSKLAVLGQPFGPHRSLSLQLRWNLNE